MATVTVLKFSNLDGAADALHIVHDLDKQQLITLIDAAMIAWPAGKKSPTTRQLLPPLLAMAIEEGTSVPCARSSPRTKCPAWLNGSG